MTTFHRYNFRKFSERIGVAEMYEIFDAIVKDGLPPGTSTQNGPWLCGGAVRDVIDGKETKTDWDLFFRDEKQHGEAAAWLESNGRKSRETETNITFQMHSQITVQAIHIRYYPTIEAVLDSFDFTICQLGYVDGELVVGPYSLFDLARKRLALHELTYGISTLRRLMKYSRKGFTVCPGTLADILNRTVSNPNVIDPRVISID